MEFLEKARVRLEHWIHHNEHHGEDYGEFARELDKAGKSQSSEYIKEMIELTRKTTECLKKALKALE